MHVIFDIMVGGILIEGDMLYEFSKGFFMGSCNSGLSG